MGLSTPSTGGGAQKDAEYVTGSSNSELSNETVVSPAGDILTSGSFGSTVSLSPGFGSFTQVSADHPSLLLLALKARTDGSSNGIVEVAVDEAGGTTADYTAVTLFADKDVGVKQKLFETTTLPLPAGAQFIIKNIRDPRNFNEVSVARAQILSP